MIKAFFDTVKKVYFSHDIVLWLVILLLPVGVSLFMVEFFSARTILHVPIGIVQQDASQLAYKLESGLRSDPVLHVTKMCGDFAECEQAMVRGELQAFVVIPYDMERRALRLEAPVIPVFSSGQNYLANSFATKEIRAVVSSLGEGLFTAGIANPVRVELHAVGNEEGNYQGFLGFGLVSAIFHMAAILGAVYVFSFPFREHTVRDMLKIAGESRMVLFTATMLPFVIIQWVSFMATYVYARRTVSPMSPEEFIMVSAGQLAMVLASAGAGATFVGITGNMRVSSSVSGVIGGPAFAFVGQTFPLIGMPFVVRCYAYLLPLTHILKIQSAMLLGPVGIPHAWDCLVTLLFMALFWMLLATRLLAVRWASSRNKELDWVREHGKTKDKIWAAIGAVYNDLNPANHGIGKPRGERKTSRLKLNLLNPQSDPQSETPEDPHD